MINILILSVGTRNKIVQYFKENMNKNGEKIGNIITTDASSLAPALYEGDKHYIVPRIDSKEYIESVLEICRNEKINAVLSLIDPELNIIANNKEKFDKLGIKIIGSEKLQCDISLDKMKMYNTLVKKEYKTPKSYKKIEKFIEDYKAGLIDFPVFVKPIDGSASNLINKIDNIDTLMNIIKNNDSLIIQEYMDGQEIGIDVYVDLISREVVSMFAKKKLKMRAGETDKSVSFKDQKLFDLIEKFVTQFGYMGQLDIDVFEKEGEYFISEVNPRFGGGYPHAYESGVNHIEMIINNLQGKVNKKNIGNYKENIYMMKYIDLLVKEM